MSILIYIQIYTNTLTYKLIFRYNLFDNINKYLCIQNDKKKHKSIL